jgi:hypothetical protein
MQWSKLKTRVLLLLDPALRKRIDFHVTSYRKSHDETEKAWITVDGEIVFTASWYQHQWGTADSKPQDFGDVLRQYPDMPIQKAIHDSDPLIRALAIVDRRLGARQLVLLKPRQDEHPLLALFYKLRMEQIAE